MRLKTSGSSKAMGTSVPPNVGPLERLARFVIEAPKFVLACLLLAIVGAAIVGAPVAHSLLAGGFQDPTSESFRTSRVLQEQFGVSDMSLVLLLASNNGITSAEVRRVADDLQHALRDSPYVMNVASAWDKTSQDRSSLVSKDGRSGLIVAGLAGGDNDAPKHAAELIERLGHDRDGVAVKAGGLATIIEQTNVQTGKDLVVMESIALPLSFVALVWIFGGLYAALLPLSIGLIAIVGSLAILRGLTLVTDVSVFALNLTMALGLALAIDYSLLIISRYRDEVAGGKAREEAMVMAIRTAGRTVLFSAMTVALAMMALMGFPMYFLKSIAYAGVAVVLLCVTAALIVVPASTVLLGDRIDALDIQRGIRNLLGRPARPATGAGENIFYRTAVAVMRRPLRVAIPVVAILLFLGTPIFNLHLGFGDERTLPGSLSSRQVGDQIRQNFPNDAAADITIVASNVNDVSVEEVGRYAARLSLVDAVSAVSAPTGTYAAGHQIGPASPSAGMRNGTAVVVVRSSTALYTDASESQLDSLHAVPPPEGVTVGFGGQAQIARDSVQGITSRLPHVLTAIAVVSFALLFALTGSLVLPLKALVLNIISLSATFGALVWVFQDGHLGGLGTTASGTLTINMLILLFCIAFGLSMDYEVFLISRIREYWLASSQTRADNDEAVALGLARTGRVVTAAALIMTISFAALIASQVSFMRMFGLGLAVAVVVDATAVRMLLLPAFMRLMGRANWWAPAPVARWHARWAVTD